MMWGDSMTYRKITTSLPSDQDVYAAQQHGSQAHQVECNKTSKRLRPATDPHAQKENAYQLVISCVLC